MRRSRAVLAAVVLGGLLAGVPQTSRADFDRMGEYDRVAVAYWYVGELDQVVVASVAQSTHSPGLPWRVGYAVGTDCPSGWACNQWEYPAVTEVSGTVDPALQTATATFLVDNCPYTVAWEATSTVHPRRAEVSPYNGWPKADVFFERDAFAQITRCTDDAIVTTFGLLWSILWQRTDFLE